MSKTREKSNTHVQGMNHSNRYAAPTVHVQEVVACDFLTVCLRHQWPKHPRLNSSDPESL